MGLVEEISLLEEQLNALIIKYEQYFLGLEKREPLRLLNKVDQAFRRYLSSTIVNTMVKFKLNSLTARFNTYKRQWVRINRLIDEGKYSRDRFKMEMHDLDQGQRHQPEAGERRESDEAMEELFRQFIQARQECNLPVANITPGMIAEAVEKQKPAIKEKYHCDAVEFKVVIEGGKPKIKARPGRKGELPAKRQSA